VVRFGLLGPLVVRLDGSEHSVRAPLQRILLAALLLRAPAVVPSGELAETMWERPPENYRGALHNHVMRLRQTLPGNVGERLGTRSPGYCVELVPDELDLHQFTTLCDDARVAARRQDWDAAAAGLGRALALWRGRALADVPSDVLQRDEARRLEDLRLQALEWRVEADLHRRRHQELVPELRRLTREHPLHEGFRGLLMQALLLSGRPAEALTAFQDLRRDLVEGLGAEPGADLQRLHERILRGEVDRPDAGPAPARIQERTTPERPMLRRPRPCLVERDAELATLTALADRARQGQGVLVGLEGQRGIGRSTLLDTWLDAERARGATALTARCALAEQGDGFAVVRQLFERALTGPDREHLLRDGAAGAAEALALRPAGEPPPAALGALHWLCTHLAEAVAAAGRSPLVLAVDRLEWADAASLGWLSHLAHRLDGLPVVLAVSGCPGPVADRLAREPGYTGLEVPPLSPPGSVAVVGAAYGTAVEPAFALACHDVSGGVPGVLRDVVRALLLAGVPPVAAAAGVVRGQGPAVVARSVAARLERLPAATARVAQALAVLGDGAPAERLARVSGLAVADVRETVDSLHVAGVLVTAQPPRFADVLVRAAVADEAGAALDRLRVAAARAGYEDGAPAEDVAAHLLEAGPGAGGWVTEVLLDAARLARGRGDAEACARYLRRAAQEPLPDAERADVLRRLGAAELGRRPETAVRYLRQATALVTADPPALARTAGLLAFALSADHRPAEAVPVLAAALSGLTGTDPDVVQLRGQLQAQLVQVGYESVATVPVAVRCLAGLDPGGPGADTPAGRALQAAAALHAAAGHADAATTTAHLDRALRGGLRLDGPSGLVHARAAFGYLATDRLDQAEGWFDEMADQAGRNGWPRLLAVARYGLASVSHRRGDLPTALDRAASLLAERTTVGGCLPPVVGLVVNVLLDRGEPEEAARVLQAHPVDQDCDATWDLGGYLLARGRVQVARGAVAPGLAALLACGSHQEAAGFRNPVLAPWRSSAVPAQLALGLPAAARELAAEDLDAARAWGTGRAVGVALRTLGSLAEGRDAVVLLGDAVAALEGTPARLELARALRDLGRAHLAAGETQPGRRRLTRAGALAEACGATALAEECLALSRGGSARAVARR
jgi:DNA-binding SARP family transcriptional activator/tetratricopeptide (TPR) repeat protein